MDSQDLGILLGLGFRMFDPSRCDLHKRLAKRLRLRLVRQPQVQMLKRKQSVEEEEADRSIPQREAQKRNVFVAQQPRTVSGQSAAGQGASPFR